MFKLIQKLNLQKFTHKQANLQSLALKRIEHLQDNDGIIPLERLKKLQFLHLSGYNSMVSTEFLIKFIDFFETLITSENNVDSVSLITKIKILELPLIDRFNSFIRSKLENIFEDFGKFGNFSENPNLNQNSFGSDGHNLHSSDLTLQNDCNTHNNSKTKFKLNESNQNSFKLQPPHNSSLKSSNCSRNSGSSDITSL